MCAPAALGMLSFAIGAAQSVVGYMGQAAQAKAQNQYYEMNRQEAIKAANTKYAHQQNQVHQMRAQSTQENMETTLEATRARSTAKVAAGEAGVSGLSVDALLGDFYGREGRALDTIDRNFAMNADYARANMDSTQAEAISRVNSVQKAAKPSFFDAALRIAGSGINAFSSYQQQTSYG